jgi:RimJ/RimL family protein N-acetyltransferase
MDTLTKLRRRAESFYLGYGGRLFGSRRARANEKTPSSRGTIVTADDGGVLLLREIHPNDVDALIRGFSGLTAEEVRLRFLHPLTELPEAFARQLCDIDTEHAVAFVLVDPPGTPEPVIHAVARAYIDPVTLGAEFALIVQHRFAGQGLGTLLMRKLIDACRTRGALEIWGDVLAENSAMLELCDRLGFARHSVYHDPGVVRVTMGL